MLELQNNIIKQLILELWFLLQVKWYYFSLLSKSVLIKYISPNNTFDYVIYILLESVDDCINTLGSSFTISKYLPTIILKLMKIILKLSTTLMTWNVLVRWKYKTIFFTTQHFIGKYLILST